MPGEKELSTLLGSLCPVRHDEVYTFASITEDDLKKLDRPLGLFRETEGVSVIIPLSVARQLALKPEGEFTRISLGVHSSLDAIGLTAQVSTALASRGISCNVVAAFYHDHLFVPADRAHEALEILLELQEKQLNQKV